MQKREHIATPGTPVVETRNLRVSLSGHPILEGVNMKVPAGQLVALIGPNGSGKTTLLRAMLGLQKLSSGEVKLFGESDLSAVLPRVGYVPQKFALESAFILSVREFLALRLRSTRQWFWKSHKKIDHALKPQLAEMGVEDLLDQPMAQLSGGQLQRVLIAFSILNNPELLLLDEPTAGVDTPGETTFYELIARIQKHRGLTVILVSHDLSMVYRHANWVYALNRVVCCDGPPEQVINEESLKRAYGIHVSPYHHVH